MGTNEFSFRGHQSHLNFSSFLLDSKFLFHLLRLITHMTAFFKTLASSRLPFSFYIRGMSTETNKLKFFFILFRPKNGHQNITISV